MDEDKGKDVATPFVTATLLGLLLGRWGVVLGFLGGAFLLNPEMLDKIKQWILEKK